MGEGGFEAELVVEMVVQFAEIGEVQVVVQICETDKGRGTKDPNMCKTRPRLQKQTAMSGN